MQNNQEGLDYSKQEDAEGQRVGVDEKFINFRSSPNFKNMKKFLKSKMIPPDMVENVEVLKIEPKLEDQLMIHPPLPRDPPPPPDSLEPLVVPKIEKEDSPPVDEDEFMEDTIKLQEIIKKDEVEEKKKDPIVCKDFVRGSCTRPNCRFVHQNDPSSRIGVFKFCRKFQNAVCDLGNCRFVHADTFQEAHFIRTGILPPNALSHIKTNNLIKPPVLQGNPGHSRDVMQHNMQLKNALPAPPMMTPSHLEPPMPVISCIPAANSGSHMSHVKVVPESDLTHFKMNWMTNGNVPGTSQEKKKCSLCDFKEYRYQNTKQAVENTALSIESVQKKIEEVDHKTHVMNLVFLLLLRPYATQAKGNTPDNSPQMQTAKMPPYY